MPISEAAKRTEIPKTSASKIYRVFKLIDANRADDEIAEIVRDFNPRTVAGIRSAYAESLQRTGNPESIKSFLKKHRKRMHKLAAKLVRSISSDVEPWPSGWLNDNWPRPWSGPVDDTPSLLPDSEHQFSYMLDHLKKLRVREGLRGIEVYARDLGRLAKEIEQGVPKDAHESLSGDLLNAAILFGSQMAEAPEQTYPEITITVESRGAVLRMNAFSGRFSEKTEAETAEAHLRAVIDHVRHDPATSKFFAIRAETKI